MCLLLSINRKAQDVLPLGGMVRERWKAEEGLATIRALPKCVFASRFAKETTPKPQHLHGTAKHDPLFPIQNQYTPSCLPSCFRGTAQGEIAGGGRKMVQPGKTLWVQASWQGPISSLLRKHRWGASWSPAAVS